LRVAKNVIFFLGDGMGVSTVTAARIHAGQKKGQPGEENFLNFEKFPNLGLLKVFLQNFSTNISNDKIFCFSKIRLTMLINKWQIQQDPQQLI